MEAAGLAFFMVSASILTTVLEHPASAVRQAIGNRALRRVLFGIPMGLVVLAIVYSPWGKQSGAHINPAVTWAFFRLGKIAPWDATLYTIAQFGGAVGAVQLMRLAIGEPYAHAAVDYVVTKPGPAGAGAAFLAEYIISFILMLALLIFVNSRRMEKLAGVVAAVLIALYLMVETPFSGMSLNPARSFGSALAAGHWSGLWIYFVAPTLAMLSAAELYRHIRRGQQLACAKLRHCSSTRCIFCDYQKGPTYPVGAAAGRS